VSQRLRRRIGDLESRIAGVEAEIARAESELADPAVVADRDLLATAGELHRAKEEELAWLMREWEEAATEAGG
jgi:hypothetical protein